MSREETGELHHSMIWQLLEPIYRPPTSVRTRRAFNSPELDLSVYVTGNKGTSADAPSKKTLDNNYRLGEVWKSEGR